MLMAREIALPTAATGGTIGTLLTLSTPSGCGGFGSSTKQNSSSSESLADHFCKSLQRSLRHVIAAGEVMRREQEHVLDARFLARLQQPLGATLRRPEQPERIGDAARLVLGDRRRIMRLAKLEA